SRAYILARKAGFAIPTAQHLQQAAEEIGREQGLNVDLLKARIGLTQARTPLVEAQTRKAQRPPKPVSHSSGGDRGLEKAVEVFEKMKDALVEATRVGDQSLMTSLRRRLNSLAVNLASKYPQLEVGGLDSGWPYVKPRGSAGQQQQSNRPTPVEGQQMYFN